MKRNILYLALALLTISIGFVSCSDDDLTNATTLKEGDNIKFSVGGKDSRTVYNESDPWQIDWLQDGADKIRIYSAEARIGAGTSKVYADYSVAPYETTVDGQEIKASTISNYISYKNGWLEPNENGLEWGTSDTHNFYAVYPADNSKLVEYNYDNGVITFNHIASQKVTATETENGIWNCSLDMSNAYMVATATANRNDEHPIELEFEPIMTTLEITVQGPENNRSDAGIIGVSVVTTFIDPIVSNGTFQYDLKNRKVLTQENGSKELTTYVQIQDAVDTDGDGRVTLSSGDKLILSVFLPPVDLDDTNTKIIVHATRDYDTEGSTSGSGLATCYIPSDVKVNSGSKRKLTLPTLPTPLTNAWMTPLDPNIYVSQLSIPGTHDSATSTLFNTTTNIGSTQTLTIAQQLEMGIRAFDIRIMLKGSRLTIGTNTPLVGSAVKLITGLDDAEIGYLSSVTGLDDIHHGSINTNVSLDTVFEAFDDYLKKYPKEFIFVICRNETGDKYYNTQINEYIGNIFPVPDINNEYKKYFSSYLQNNEIYQSRKRNFKKDMTIGEAQGGIILLARDEYADTPDGGAFIQWSHTWPGSHGLSMKGKDDTSNVLTVQDTYSEDEDKVSNYEYNVAKPYAVMQMMDYSSDFNTNSDKVNNWMINHCSGYIGTNNYAQNAQNTNRPVYNYLIGNSVTLSGIGTFKRQSEGSTGIVLLDYVGTDINTYFSVTYQTNGTLLPQTIIDNNYKYHMKRKGE